MTWIENRMKGLKGYLESGFEDVLYSLGDLAMIRSYLWLSIGFAGGRNVVDMD